MKKTKVLTLMLAAVMLLSVLSGSAFAEGDRIALVTDVGTIDDALAKAKTL